MRSTGLGCFSASAIVAAFLVLASIMGATIYHGNAMFSPGPLSQAAGPTLGGFTSHAEIDSQCSFCHAPFWSSQTMTDRCQGCHTDIAVQMADVNSMHGAITSANPTLECRSCHPDHQGPQAPLTELSVDKFPHAALGFSLEGHAKKPDGSSFACDDCHGANLQVFDHAYCETCHRQMDVVFTQSHILWVGADCLACHDGVDTFGSDFTHSKTDFKLTGKHADVLCSTCHLDAHSKTDLQSTPQDCAGCHKADDPHAGRLGQACADCHTPDGWKPAKFDHDLASFKLAGKHADVACADCHIDGKLQGTPADCFSCHKADDKHDGRFGTDCSACHNPSKWDDVAFDHNFAAFKLTGAHETVKCESCHVNNVFQGTPQDCFSCHKNDDQHKGQFGTDCSTCHNTTSWSTVIFDHNLAAFKLTGAHTAAACTDCHKNGVFKGTPADCYSCHKADDTHNGRFGRDCGSCHRTSTWKGAIFDHSKAAFQLVGAHQTVACEDCHKNGQFKGTPQDCYSCHKADDGHNGQFGTDCGSCHKPTTWKDATFDHNKTGFKLEWSHKGVACDSCHTNGKYKGTPTDCYSCHKADDGHKGQFGTDCGSCHKPTSWKDATFDHNKSAFKLTGAHQSAACTDCHKNGQYKGTPSDCYSCHKADDNHKGQFGKDCGTCHTTSSWKGASFDHDKIFKLEGAHKNLACAKCHPNGQYKGTPQTCYGCHKSDDKHNGQNGTDCGACHKQTTWTGATFDHSKTNFPLEGKHANVNCGGCHKNGKFAGTPTACYACHKADDKHNGSNGTSCGSCHDPTGWGNVDFNHDKTNFPLDGKHAKVACDSCHQNGKFAGTPTACYACHKADDKHNGRNGTGCGSCHNPTGWGNVDFNHNKTNFPLEGKHTKVSCGDCHQNGKFAGTPTNCYACHKNDDKHKGSKGTDCAKCHTPKGWD